MKSIATIAVLAGLAFAAGGCAHSAMRSTVAMKTGPEEAHVCLGENEVKAGDKVDLFKNECWDKARAFRQVGGAICRLVPVGEGEVSQVLNEHYSIVHVTKGVPFDEGTIVQKRPYPSIVRRLRHNELFLTRAQYEGEPNESLPSKAYRLLSGRSLRAERFELSAP